MIDPNDTIDIEVGGSTYSVRVLRRSEKRRVLDLVEGLQAIEASASSLSVVLDTADRLANLLLVGMSDDQIDSLDESTIFDIAGEALGRQVLGDADKKKSASLRLSDSGKLHETAMPDVFVTSEDFSLSAQPAGA